MINKHYCWCKNELFYKGNRFFVFVFEKGGAHAPVAPPGYGLAWARCLKFIENS